MPLEIRLLKDSEYKAANDFYNNSRNISHPAKKTVRKYSEFCWEFINRPNGKAIYAGAWDVEDKKEPVIVGIQCVIIHKMISADGNCFYAAKGEDTLIEINALIKFKKTDILRELLTLLIDECRGKGIEYLWGFNNIPATYKRLGFENPYKSFYGVLVLNPVHAYKNIAALKSTNIAFGKLKIAILSGLSYLFSLKKIFILSQKKNYHINFEINENAGLFQRAAFHDQLVFLLQDTEYLTWRISENPYPVKYKSYQLLDHDNMLHAQVLCSINNKVAFIEQTLFDKNLDRKSVNFLLKEVIQSLKNENIGVVRYTGFKHNILNKREMRLLKKMGFIFTGKGEWFTFKKLSAASEINPDNIYLSRIYKQGRN
ncbi:MAG: hypothetical protein NTX61_03355 [Bacteroidetes bacterium]|nr:hypothetical protein [Bacteroidota bacterium]